MLKRNVQEGVVIGLFGKAPHQYVCAMLRGPRDEREQQLRSLIQCQEISPDGYHVVSYSASEKPKMKSSGTVRVILSDQGGSLVPTHWAYI